MIIRASHYGDSGEKINANVAMISREVCPDCKGKGETLETKFGDINIKHIPCKRCNYDGYLDNPVKFVPEAMTCASNIHKLGTFLRVTYDDKKSGKWSVIVMVTDRGPGKEGRHDWIDLSEGAFERIAPLELGVIDVDVEVL
jgi:hypothetical protein